MSTFIRTCATVATSLRRAHSTFEPWIVGDIAKVPTWIIPEAGSPVGARGQVLLEKGEGLLFVAKQCVYKCSAER